MSSPRTAFLLSLSLAILPASAAKPRAKMVKDVNKTRASANPDFGGFLDTPRGMLLITDDLKSGSELRLATNKGTRLLKDIRPGGAGSAITYAATMDGVVYFSAYDGTHGHELWRSDGTPKGTRLLLDLVPGPASSSPIPAFAAGGRIYFHLESDITNPVLWSTDPSGSTPQALNPLAENPQWEGQRIFHAGDFVRTPTTTYFSSGDELWKTDGTQTGSVRVLEDARVSGPIVAIGETLYFYGLDADSPGKSLWAVRPGASDRERVIATSSDARSGSQEVLTILGHRLFFTGTDTSGNLSLWVTDGTPEGCTRLMELGAADQIFYPVTVWKEHVYFAAQSAGGDTHELWRSDGTSAGTSRVATFPEDVAGIEQLAGTTRTLHVDTALATGGAKLWQSDGTPGSLRELHATPRFYTIASREDRLYFADHAFDAQAVWRTSADGRKIQRLTKNEKRTLSSLSASSVDDGSLVAAGDRAFFVARPGGDDLEIWTSNGSARGTRAIWSGEDPDRTAVLKLPTTVGDQAIFTSAGVDRDWTRRIWISDGTPTGTRVVKEFAPEQGYPDDFFTIGDTVYFRLSVEPHARLWATDGTPEGTREVTAQAGDAPIPSAGTMVEMNGVLYFIGENGEGARTSLWRSNGTDQGTWKVEDLASAGGLARLSVVGDELKFFTGGGGTFTLWSSDGTPGGTTAEAELAGHLQLQSKAGDTFVFALDNKLYRQDPDGIHPFATLPEQAEVLGNIHGDPYFARSHAPTGKHLFFLLHEANDPIFKDQPQTLWRTDGTAAGTYRLKAFPSLPDAGAYPRELLAHGDGIYFNATDPDHGAELWHSDGTKEGTRLAADVEPGSRSSRPALFTVAGPKLFFKADRARHGVELHVLPLPKAKKR